MLRGVRVAALVADLFRVADELYAREYTHNTVYKEFHDVSWEELCDKGIELLEEIKVG